MTNNLNWPRRQNKLVFDSWAQKMKLIVIMSVCKRTRANMQKRIFIDTFHVPMSKLYTTQNYLNWTNQVKERDRDEIVTFKIRTHLFLNGFFHLQLLSINVIKNLLFLSPLQPTIAMVDVQQFFRSRRVMFHLLFPFVCSRWDEIQCLSIYSIENDNDNVEKVKELDTQRTAPHIYTKYTQSTQIIFLRKCFYFFFFSRTPLIFSTHTRTSTHNNLAKCEQ